MKVYDVGVIIFLWVKEFQMLVNWKAEAKKCFQSSQVLVSLKIQCCKADIKYVSGSRRC